MSAHGYDPRRFETAAAKTARADACLTDDQVNFGILKHAVTELKLDPTYVIRELLFAERDSRKLTTIGMQWGTT